MLGWGRVAATRSVTKRAPVLAALPAQLLALHATHRRHQQRTGFIQEPVRLRLASAEPRRRIEAVDDALAIEKQQPILRTTLRREIQQRQLIRR
jgi:hypothetical protein